MTSPLLPLIGVLLLSTPTTSAQPTPPTVPILPTAKEGDIPLRAHVLEMPGIQWRADLLDGLEYVEQAGSHTVWKADAATLKRLVDASANCRPAGTASGLGSSQRIHYVASLKRTAQAANGRTTSLSFVPTVGNVLNGLELDAKSIRAQGGVLADITIRDCVFAAFHQVQRREEVWSGSRSTPITATLQVPEMRHQTVIGRWLIPAGGVVVVSLGVHGHSDILWGQDGRRERVVVIDAGDVAASAFAQPPPFPDPWWVNWLPPIDWPAVLTGLLGAVFLAGWFVRGTASRVRDRRSMYVAMEPVAGLVSVEGGQPAGTRRAPTLADVMVLIAGTAVACLLVQTSVGPIDPTNLWDSLTNSPAASWTALNIALVLGELGTLIVVPLLAVGSATLAMTVICVPRPNRSRLVRRPGVMACLQVGLVVVLVACVGLARYVGASQPGGVEDILGYCSVFLAVLSGLAVASCWLTMAMTGVWRPEASWVDRLGRVLGTAWIAILPFVLLFAFLMER